MSDDMEAKRRRHKTREVEKLGKVAKRENLPPEFLDHAEKRLDEAGDNPAEISDDLLTCIASTNTTGDHLSRAQAKEAKGQKHAARDAEIAEWVNARIAGGDKPYLVWEAAADHFKVSDSTVRRAYGITYKS
jgi:hypothetical protein